MRSPRQPAGGRPGAAEYATLEVRDERGERSFALDRAEYSIGRDAGNDIRIDVDVISGIQGRLIREGAAYRYIQAGRSNPTLLLGVPVSSHLLRHGDHLEIAPGTPQAVTLTFALPEVARGPTTQFTRPFKLGEAIAPAEVKRLALPEEGTVTIGRSSDNDLVLSSLSVSRVHAKLDLRDGVAKLLDAGSANGTYVNGALVQAHTLNAGDIIRIGPYKLAFRDGALEHHDDSRAVRLDAYQVRKLIGANVILSGVTFCAQPGEVVAIAGTSGAGKSTLLDALNGMRPPTSGHVLVNGADLYRAFDALRPLIGYVPQENILPAHLPLERALRYVARLRLPGDVTAEDVRARVEHVLQVLDLTAWRTVPIGQMSGGQQKRASIAAELIAQPGLFFLDEPTSGLDPGLTWRVTEIVRGLAAGGCTVVVISHDVESLLAADKIVFLAAGGRVVFIGSPQEALSYFGVEELGHIYPRVDADDSAVWEDRFRASDQYRLRVAPALLQPSPGGESQPARVEWDPVALFSAATRRSASAWQQFRVTIARYAETLLRDRRNLALLLAQAPVIALLLTLVARSTDLRPPSPEAVAQAAAFGIPAAKLAAALPVMMAATATWFGAINAAREIVKELPILRRERLAGLRIAPYLASKVAVLALLCVIQTGVLLAVIAAKVDIPGAGTLLPAWLELWISLILAAFAALGLGLLISATVSNADRAQSLVPIVLIPQLIFVGGPGTGAVGQWLSYLTVTHWSSEAMKVTLAIPYDADGSGFGTVALLSRWGALAAMAAILLLLSAWRLARQRSA